MKCRHQAMASYLITGFLLSGCASTFDPRLTALDLGRPGLPGAIEVRAGVEISIEEFASAHKSRKAFDAELASRGILPLLVRIENHAAADAVVRSKQIQASADGRPLAPLHGFQAAEFGASRNAAWNALVNTAAIGPLAIFFWPATMAGSASQTERINRRVERHFESLELADSLVKPGEKVAGFVFFQMPNQSQSWESISVEAVLAQEIAGESAPTPLRFNLSLPAPEPFGSERAPSFAPPWR